MSFVAVFMNVCLCIYFFLKWLWCEFHTELMTSQITNVDISSFTSVTNFSSTVKNLKSRISFSTFKNRSLGGSIMKAFV